VYGGVVLLAVALAVTGPHLAHLYRTKGAAFLHEVGGAETALYVVSSLALLGAPALIGMFWGAPLVTRELDAGTHRLAWTQTTRTRWLAVKLGFVGVAAMAAAGLLGLAVTWWAGPIDRAVAGLHGRPGPGIFTFSRLSPEMFDARGVVPLGYAAFFFVLGVTVGVITRRTLPAMAVLLALFTVIQIVTSVWVRPRLVAPEHLTTRIDAGNLMNINMLNHVHVTIDAPGAWITSQRTVDAAGHPVNLPSWVLACPGDGPANRACFARLADLGYRQQVTYQPAGRFWPLQLAETGIYLGLALLVAVLCVWWVRRRLS
jgi:hypothetical protein